MDCEPDSLNESDVMDDNRTLNLMKFNDQPLLVPRRSNSQRLKYSNFNFDQVLSHPCDSDNDLFQEDDGCDILGSKIRSSNKSHMDSRIDCSKSVSSSSNLSGIAAVFEMRGPVERGCIGIAFIDIRCPTLLLSQIIDSSYGYAKTVNKLICLEPNEVVLACSQAEATSGSAPTGLLAILQEYIPSVKTWSRRKFDLDIGRNTVNFLCAKDYRSIISELSDACFCACGGLLDYLQETMQICLTHNDRDRPWLKIVYQSADCSMFMNSSTFNDLNIVGTHGLYSLLKFTYTAAGTRLLRCSLSQPLSNYTVIEQRLDAVQELLDSNNRQILSQLKTCLQSFPDLEKALFSLATNSRIVNVGIPSRSKQSRGSAALNATKFEKIAERLIGDVIMVKHSLDLIRPLSDSLSLCKTHLLSCCSRMLSDDKRFNNLSKTLASVIHSDAKFQEGLMKSRTQKCYAIKPGINQLLDVARKAYSEVVDDIIEYIAALNEKHGETMEIAINFSQNRGFHGKLRWLPVTRVEDRTLPNGFMYLDASNNKCVSSKWQTFTTPILMRLNERSNDSIMDVFRLSHCVLVEVIESVIVNDELACLHRLLECVALVDLIQSLSHNAKLRRYTRPILRPLESGDYILKAKNARHPMLDTLASKIAITANDIYFNTTESPMLIITGPNMTGKTTILKMIGLITVMAQIGSYVPADEATLSITNQLFTRMCHDQLVPQLNVNISSMGNGMLNSTSSHIHEMQEMAFILHCLNPSIVARSERTVCNSGNNLVLVDELCRGIEQKQALALSFCIYEHLLVFGRTMTIATSHLPAMVTNLCCLYPQVSVSQMDELFRIFPGQCDKLDYGIRLAEKSKLFPDSVISNALKSLEEHKNEELTLIKVTKDVERVRMVVKFWREWESFKQELKSCERRDNEVIEAKCLEFSTKIENFVRRYSALLSSLKASKESGSTQSGDTVRCSDEECQ
ncbi:hypothetical protein ACOME3_000495 [Neoechinorhynchus agilis]